VDELEYDFKNTILNEVVNGQMANIGMKTISFAYKRMARDDLDELKENFNPETKEFREAIQ